VGARIDSVKGNARANPQHLTECAPTINRPHHLLAHPDGKTVILAGTPNYGYTGGGVLLWNRETKVRRLLEDTEVIPNQSTMSMVPLPAGKLLGGTTTSPGTGGEKKAGQAELYILDLATAKMEWHEPAIPGVQTYTAMGLGAEGLVFGFADRDRFFVFDPKRRVVIHQENTGPHFGPCVSQQGPRVFVSGPGDTLYVLFTKGIAAVDRRTFKIQMLAASPVAINAGGDYLDGRIFFGSGSHVYSWRVATAQDPAGK
jgi:hypothetical protein